MSNRREVVVEHVIVQRTSSLFGLLLVAGFIVWLWKWVLLIVGICAALVLAYYLVKALAQRQAEQAAAIEATRQRADRQLNGWMSGDPRATFGWETTDGKDARS